MQTKRQQENYFLLDHRNSPGLTDVQTNAVGLPPGSGRGMFEAPAVTCSHCQKGIVLNPLRNRDRAWCRGCDRYICDDPCGIAYKASGGVCRTFKQLVDELYEQGLKETPRQ